MENERAINYFCSKVTPQHVYSVFLDIAKPDMEGVFKYHSGTLMLADGSELKIGIDPAIAEVMGKRPFTHYRASHNSAYDFEDKLNVPVAEVAALINKHNANAVVL